MRTITTICLVRHGQTDWNALGKLQGQTDIPLNELGKIQARQCGEFLSKNDWDVIISSPLKGQGKRQISFRIILKSRLLKKWNSLKRILASLKE